MKKLPDGKIIIDKPHEKRILKEVNRLLEMRNSAGNFADWTLSIECSQNGSQMKMRITKLDIYPQVKVTRKGG
jgi:hypothetical protein